MSNAIKFKKIIIFISITAVIFISFVSFYSLNKKRPRILLIGLDGASWKIILPLVREGKLPNIKRLMDSGCWGKLATLEPPVSEIIWTTIATGKTPEAHGISDNLIPDIGTGEMIPPTSNLRKVKAIWNILSECGKKVGIVGYPVTWPAEKVNGVMISDRGDQNKYSSQGYSEPPSANPCSGGLFENIKQIEDIPAVFVNGNNIFGQDIFMSNFAICLLQSQDFDFFCLYIRGIDTVSHLYWKYAFPTKGQEIPSQDISKYKGAINDCYIWHDKVIGNLLKLADKDTTVIIVSDHGFMSKHQTQSSFIFSRIDNLLEAAGLKEFKYQSKSVMLENTQDNIFRYLNNIKIKGNLNNAEFTAVRENAKSILKSIKVKETGWLLFEISYDTPSGFVLQVDNRYIGHSPGYHMLINGREYEVSDFLIKVDSLSDHDANDAVIIMSGKNIRKHRQLKDAGIYDIVPTVLYMLDLPVAKDMPGKILINAIGCCRLWINPIRYIDTHERDKKQLPQKPIRSPLDEKIIKERMRTLGYIN